MGDSRLSRRRPIQDEMSGQGRDMNKITALAVAVLIVTNVLQLIIAVSRDPVVVGGDGAPFGIDDRLGAIESSIEVLLARRSASARPLSTASSRDAREDGEEGEPATRVATELAALRKAVAELSKTVADLAPQGPAARPEPPDFAADDGFVVASKLFEDGKYGSAAEGMLEFVEHHPDHPDRRDIMARARKAFARAGMVQRAVDLQKEIIEAFPKNRGDDYSTLARMEFDRKNYDAAVSALDESIALTRDPQEELWRRMYRAWYIELGRGPAAGIAAYKEVDAVREGYGIENAKMTERIAKKVADLEKRGER